MIMGVVPAPSFAHLAALTDGYGTFEHADHTTPRREHGYCTDDMARLLIIAAREPAPDAATRDLARVAFRFLADAQGVTGTTRNRKDAKGRWHGRRGVEDCWGRSMWAFGTAAARADESWLRQNALSCFERGTEQRSPWPRAMAAAALGAVEVLAVEPNHSRAIALLDDAALAIGGRGIDAAWPWPEPRLTYANALLPDAMIAIGTARDRPELVRDGVALLTWLIERQMNDGHLSPIPVGGAGPADVGPRFDQQPIEVAALADACARAATVTGDPTWATHLRSAVGWFLGDNDAGTAMVDLDTGGGYDGLERDGANQNQGAESSIAAVAVLQHARGLIAMPA
jgi:hypothetical protein